MSNLNNQINQIGQQLRAESAENALTQARSALHIERMQNISASSSSDLGDTLSIISLEAQIVDLNRKIKVLSNPDTEALLEATKRADRLEEELNTLKSGTHPILLEWKHSDEARKLLCRSYAEQLKLTDSQRQSDFDKFIVNVSEANTEFGVTDFGARARVRSILKTKNLGSDPKSQWKLWRDSAIQSFWLIAVGDNGQFYVQTTWSLFNTPSPPKTESWYGQCKSLKVTREICGDKSDTLKPKRWLFRIAIEEDGNTPDSPAIFEIMHNYPESQIDEWVATINQAAQSSRDGRMGGADQPNPNPAGVNADSSTPKSNGSLFKRLFG